MVISSASSDLTLMRPHPHISVGRSCTAAVTATPAAAAPATGRQRLLAALLDLLGRHGVEAPERQLLHVQAAAMQAYLFAGACGARTARTACV